MNKGSKTEEEENIRSIIFDAMANALYHTARRGWLEFVDRIFALIVVLGGTATVAQFFYKVPNGEIVLGIAITTVAALQLVFRFSNRANDHAMLQKQYYNLVADILSVTEPTCENVAEWRGELHKNYGAEPPTMYALNAVAYNQAVAHFGHKDTSELKVNRWQNFTKNIFSHQGTTFSPKAEPNK